MSKTAECMEPPPLRVLIIDDEESIADNIREGLERSGYRCKVAYTTEAGKGLIRTWSPEIVITDLMISGQPDGLELLRFARQADPNTEVLLITGYATVDTCRAALQQGAFDYISKPLNLGELRAVIQKPAEKIILARQVRDLHAQLDEKFGFEQIVGRSGAMTRIIKTLRQVASSDIPVLLQGESGTGKELLANAIHANSPRMNCPFVPLNCAGLSESILEDELFGHVKGAFTGATADRKGRFEHADGGTLFLDEIGDMPPSFQAKLLRVLENGEMVRLGANEPIRVDVRLISATNHDLHKLVADKRFRQDLFFRIKGVTVTIPPLRDRRQDIPLLIEYFLQLASKEASNEGSGEGGRAGGSGGNRAGGPAGSPKVRRLTPAAQRVLTEFDWPGNVRQLKTAIDTMLVLSDKEVLDVGDIPEEIRGGSAGGGSAGSLVGISMEQAERLLIKNTLALVGGNREQAAKMLGIGERTLYRKIKDYGLE